MQFKPAAPSTINNGFTRVRMGFLELFLELGFGFCLASAWGGGGCRILSTINHAVGFFLRPLGEVHDQTVVIQHGETSNHAQVGQFGNAIERHRFHGDFCLLVEVCGGTRDSVSTERISSEILWNHQPRFHGIGYRVSGTASVSYPSAVTTNAPNHPKSSTISFDTG